MKEKNQFKIYSKEELMELLKTMDSQKEKLLNRINNNYQPIIGDMRTQQVQHGNYITMFKGNCYFMTTFVGIVTEIRNVGINPSRARVVIELQDGKRLAFFANIDKYIKVNSIIEAIGVCIKNNNGFYDFNCIGGYRRIITSEEFSQLSKGISFDDLKINSIPWDIISYVKETERINTN